MAPAAVEEVLVRRDDVDDVQDAWQREIPGLPVASIGVITRLWRVSKLIADDRRRRMATLGLEPAMRDLLAILRREGAPWSLTPGQIAERAAVSPGAVSQRLARAEARGWVECVVTPSGRRTRCTLTVAGRALVDETVEQLMAEEEALLASLTRTERNQLSGLLRILLADLTARSGRPVLDL